MKGKRCYCNGLKGADCDWCQGSGWRKKSCMKPVSITVKPNSLSKEDVRQKVLHIEDDNIYQNQKQRKTFDERIEELKLNLDEVEKSFLIEIIEYLGRKIYSLNFDITHLESRVTPKKRKHYNSIKSQADKLIKDFEKKFGGIVLVQNIRQKYNSTNSNNRFYQEKSKTTLSSLLIEFRDVIAQSRK